MIINKTTSDALLVNSLVVRGTTGGYLTGVTEFDTDTMEATVSGSPEDASSYWFSASSEEDMGSLLALIPDVDEDVPVDGGGTETIQAKDGAAQHIRPPGKFTGKKAMDDTDTSPSDYHEIISLLVPVLVECSNCSTHFIVYLTDDEKVYETERANASDKYLTATEIVDPGSYACDNCSNTVALLRE
jgi:hypothetical protein